MSEWLRCAHGIEGGVSVVVECNQRLKMQIDDALKALRFTCVWRKGDGYYVSGCSEVTTGLHSHSASDEPEQWKFCPYCGGVIPQPLFPNDDGDEIDLHG